MLNKIKESFKKLLKFARPNPRQRDLIALGIAAVLIGADQFTKWWVVNNIEHRDLVQGLRIGGFDLIGFTHIYNDGAAFGILSGHQTLLIIVTGVFLVGAIIAVLSGRLRDKLLFMAVNLIIAGGIGNFIDRVRFRYVIDFIELQFVRFAVFNVADIFAVAGAVLLCMAIIAEEVRDYKAKRACAVEVAEAGEVGEAEQAEEAEKSDEA